MNLKKLVPISDHFPYVSFSRTNKVLSGFGLALVSFFIVLCVVFFNVSFKNPILNNKTSVISWSFSFTRIPSVNSTSIQNPPGKLVTELGDRYFSNFTSNVRNESSDLGVFNGTVKNGIFDSNSEKKLNFDDTLLSNFTNNVNNGSSDLGFFNGTVKNGVFDSNSKEKSNLDDTHLSNFTTNVKSGSSDLGVFNNTVKNGLFDTNSEEKSILDDTHLSNFTSDLKDGSFVATTTKNPNLVLKDRGNEVLVLSNHSSSSYKECDIFKGRWVRDDTKPYYRAGSCPYIDRDFDCHVNKRPDDEYVKWKWQPFGCEIPSLNATDFLERLRGKKLVFVGDSLNRNMWESLVCILRDSVTNKNRVYEISGRHEFKKKGFYAFRFEDYNCTVDFVSSPFLVRESTFNGKNSSFETLRLDLMDKTTSMYHDADVLVFNTGHWWTHEKTSRGEDYYQEGEHVYPRLKVLDAYRRALSTWARWVDKNIDINKTQVIFRGYSVTHFKGGQWNSGGQCHKETEPIFNSSHLTKYPTKMRAFDNVLKQMKTPIIYLNISRLTDYRKDGHPSIYRMEYKSVEEQIAAERSQDCSHWCLPGVPDTWNELLYASLLKIGRGSWKI